MFIGRVFMGKRYTLQQIVHTFASLISPSHPTGRDPPTRADGILFSSFLSVRSLAKIALAVVSSGVVIATLSRPRAGPALPATTNHTSTTGASAAVAHSDASRGTYTMGIAMLVASLICTGVHGALQERTYNRYGPHWRESVFYTVRAHAASTRVHPDPITRVDSLNQIK